MHSVDVVVARGTRALANAPKRPIRVTPTERPGVVYKKRVYELRVTNAEGFWIDVDGEFWDQEECPLASTQLATRLISLLKQPLNITGDSRKGKSPAKTDLAASSESKRRAPSSAAKDDSLDEILRLLSLKSR